MELAASGEVAVVFQVVMTFDCNCCNRNWWTEPFCVELPEKFQDGIGNVLPACRDRIHRAFAAISDRHRMDWIIAERNWKEGLWRINYAMKRPD